MTTLDFELEIGPGVASSYPVLAGAAGREAATPLRWSLAPAELDHQLAVIKDKVLASSAVGRRLPTDDEYPVRELGQRLFEALIADEVSAVCGRCGSRRRCGSWVWPPARVTNTRWKRGGKAWWSGQRGPLSRGECRGGLGDLVRITPDGICHLRRGCWQATVAS